MWRPERSPPPTLTVAQAVGLGLLHGPAELLPISSSGHTAVVPWLLGWRYHELRPEQRKSFEVALHGGTLAAILLLRSSGRRVRRLDGRVLAVVVLASLPAGLTGYALEDAIQERLGTPLSIAVGLVAGSVAMVLAERVPGRRDLERAGLADAMWIGTAQAAALVPGVSRHGATLAAARLRGFTPESAQRLSELLALPPIVGASALRLLQPTSRLDPPAAAGAAAAFASTAAALPAVRPLVRGGVMWPFALYRIALAAAILVRLRGRRAADAAGPSALTPGSTARPRPSARA